MRNNVVPAATSQGTANLPLLLGYGRFQKLVLALWALETAAFHGTLSNFKNPPWTGLEV
jgi:hypothetical protein